MMAGDESTAVETPPQDEATEHTVESRIAQMEQRIQEGKPVVEAEQEETEDESVSEREAEEVDAREQAGDGDEVGEGDDEEEAAGEEREEEGEEHEDEEDDEDDVLSDEDVFRASLPGRRPGDPDIELEIAGLTQPEQEAINRLRNGYMRGEDYRTQLDALKKDRTTVQSVAREMEFNPIGYIDRTVDVELQKRLARFLLTKEEVYAELAPMLSEWEDDPSRREGEAAKIERDILKDADKARRRHEVDEKAREEGDRIISHLEGLAENLSEAKLHRFMRFALADLEDHIKKNPNGELTTGLVDEVLAATGVYETFGITPEKKRSTPPRKVRRKTPTRSEPEIEDARSTSEKFKKTRARKRSATASAPPGSGAPPVSLPIKKGETVEERIALIEKHGIPKTI